MNEFLMIISQIGSIMGGIFNALDSVYIADYSVLDIFLALIVLRIALWFLFALINPFFRGFSGSVQDESRERINDRLRDAKMNYRVWKYDRRRS